MVIEDERVSGVAIFLTPEDRRAAKDLVQHFEMSMDQHFEIRCVTMSVCTKL